MEVKIIQECTNQETKQRCRPDDVIDVGEMEAARLCANGMAIPLPDGNIRNAMVKPKEHRRGRR